MKKTLIILVAIVTLMGLVAGGVYYYVTNLPQYALQQMVKEVEENGISAIEPHLTSSMKKMYQTVSKIAQNPLVKLVAKSDLGAKFLSLLDQGKELTWNLRDVKRGNGTTDISLSVTDGKYSGSIDVNMVFENGKWYIQDVSIPTTEWLF